ncbi:GGDEF domain-containing protein [Marilutibacter chinensis]|uniref:diguanylate cyclase n=1 Tax=Marilutibacter chinensis TaxID=2912247 RepID=A0ABS9HV49_9GAMM|nr:GGDEF domain-containing protein [Lysobacter chinensis]MCF7222563.1 GGDEF domain-containing protein [Lysobacter chinensis]
MLATDSGLKAIVSSLLSRPDEIMLEIGASGELAVARLRAVIAGVLLLLPLANMLAGGSIDENLIGLAGAVIINILAQVWLALSRRRRHYRWLPFVTTVFDVSVATLVLVLLASHHLPAALNSLIVWCGYLLAILLTALRSDGRVTLLAGATAMVQYGLLILAVFAVAKSPEELISIDYGTVTAASQWQRLILLAVATVITAMVVYRMQQLVQMSGTDGLTGLPNRTWLIHRMPRLFEAADSENSSLTVALINLDGFRQLNDELGHGGADRALQHLVALLNGLADSGEWLARVRGDEFVLVLRKPIGTAWERVDAVRRIVADHSFEPDRSSVAIRMSFSAGLACYPHDGRSLSALLRRADRRLQMAKRGGRNRVVLREE